MRKPLLLLSIDVEEDMPDWQILEHTQLTNIRALPRLAEDCAARGVRPTYLCNHPVATDDESASILRDLASRGGCEIGTHIHAWNTPPYEGVPGREGDERRQNYFQFELDHDVCRAKLESVHQAVTALAGEEPVSFRAGRFGMDEKSMQILVDLGYLVDTSITPLVSHAVDGGRNFRHAPHFPYRPDSRDITRPGTMPIVEIPVSVGMTRKLPVALQRAYAWLPRVTRLRGVLSSDYLNVVDFAWLYPARFELELMKRVVDVLVARNIPMLNVFLHSSELAPGVSENIRTVEEADRCFDRLNGLLKYCIEVHGAEPMTLREAGEHFAPQLGLEKLAKVG